MHFLTSPAQLHVGSVDGAGVRARCLGVSALRLSDANSGSHRGSCRGPKDSRLPRPGIAASSPGSGSPQPTPQTRRILTAHRPPSPMCASRPDGSGPARRIAPFKSLCSPDNCSSGCPKSGFRGSGCRISASFRISAHSPIEKPRSILLRFLVELLLR